MELKAKYHIGIMLFLAMTTGIASGQNSISGTVHEFTVRSWATKIVTPEFPRRAFVAHQFGVAVALVTVDGTGGLKEAKMIQSPSPEISKAMLSAISGWIFTKHKTNDGSPFEYSGKLTYYFERKNGKPVVYGPTDSFFVGPQR